MKYEDRLSTPLEDSPLSKILNYLSINDVYCSESQLYKPWAIRIPSFQNTMMYHFVLEGSLTIEIQGETFELNKGEFLLLPKNIPHNVFNGETTYFTDFNNLPIQVINERFERLTYGRDGELTRLFCGSMTCEHPLANRIINKLPKYIKLNNQNAFTEEALASLITEESQELDVGASAVISRLAEVLVITAIRNNINTSNKDSFAWLKALDDRRIMNALELIHQSPETHWTLEDLAKEVGMSRTSFANNFKTLIGNSPIEYLTSWRISLAYSKLMNSNASILSIAMDFGYKYESAFSRAFKKIIGSTPSEVRKQFKR